MFISELDNLVYQYDKDFEWSDCGELLRSLKEEGITHEVADRCNVEELFESNPARYRMFRRMLAGDCVGYVLRNKKEWVAYGWLSLPSSKFFPPHLPVKITSRNAAWLFYTRTNEPYRGRGCCKVMNMLRIRHARSIYADLPIYADNTIDNLSAISAKRKSGFVPCGRIRGVCVRLPRMGNVIRLGNWDREAVHPAI